MLKAMRRGALLITVLMGLVAPGAAAAPQDVTVSQNRFSPSTVTVEVGEGVTWRFTGPDLDHSATSNPGQAESWDSDPGDSSPLHRPGDAFTHVFTKPGTYSYFCKLHSFMTGRVVVNGPPAAGGGQPPADTAAPALASMTAAPRSACWKRTRRCRRTSVLVRFEASEAGTATVALSGKRRRSVSRQMEQGENAVRVSTRGLPRGRYNVSVTGEDAAGNASPPARTKISVR